MAARLHHPSGWHKNLAFQQIVRAKPASAANDNEWITATQFGDAANHGPGHVANNAANIATAACCNFLELFFFLPMTRPRHEAAVAGKKMRRKSKDWPTTKIATNRRLARFPVIRQARSFRMAALVGRDSVMIESFFDIP